MNSLNIISQICHVPFWTYKSVNRTVVQKNRLFLNFDWKCDPTIHILPFLFTIFHFTITYNSNLTTLIVLTFIIYCKKCQVYIYGLVLMVRGRWIDQWHDNVQWHYIWLQLPECFASILVLIDRGHWHSDSCCYIMPSCNWAIDHLQLHVTLRRLCWWNFNKKNLICLSLFRILFSTNMATQFTFVFWISRDWLRIKNWVLFLWYADWHSHLNICQFSQILLSNFNSSPKRIIPLLVWIMVSIQPKICTFLLKHLQFYHFFNVFL